MIGEYLTEYSFLVFYFLFLGQLTSYLPRARISSHAWLTKLISGYPIKNDVNMQIISQISYRVGWELEKFLKRTYYT